MRRPHSSSTAARLLQGAGIGLAAFVAAAAAGRLLAPLEARTWDMRARFFAKPSPFSDEIRLVFLDQATLDWGWSENRLSWPWMRQAYVPLVDFCRRAGARALLMDVLFTEPSAYTADDDLALADAYTRFGRVVQAFYPSGRQTDWPAAFPLPAQPDPLPRAGLPFPAQSGTATFPIPELASAPALLGHAAAAPDPTDGVVRRISPFTVLDGRFVPGLSLAPFLLPPADPVRLEPGALRIGARTMPLDRNGLALLRYRGPSQTHATVNAKAVIQSEIQLLAGETPLIDPAFFRDKIVLFGFTAPGLYDLRPAPAGPNYPGVEIHATALDNLLAGDFLRDVPAGAARAVMLLLCLAAGVAMRAGRSGRSGAVAFVLFALAPPALAWAAYPAGWWMPVVAPAAGVLLAQCAALLMNYALEGRQKRFIKSAFSQYLSPVVIEQLVRDPSRLALGGQKKTLSILFSDLRGFTGISETLDPADLTALLNNYLTAVTRVIYEEGGTIDKYEGDAVIAFWNAPLDMADHAARAVRAAVRYQHVLADMRPALHARYGCDLFARIGINTGPVVIGNMGSAQRFNYTFLGDAGNLAARLEGINKVFGTAILISRFTRDLAGPDIPCRPVARVAVVGRREPVEIFEPLAPAAFEANRARFDAFAGGRAAFEAGRFAEALAVFEPLAQTDGPAAAYADRCRAFLREPPADWRGVWIMTEK